MFNNVYTHAEGSSTYTGALPAKSPVKPDYGRLRFSPKRKDCKDEMAESGVQKRRASSSAVERLATTYADLDFSAKNANAIGQDILSKQRPESSPLKCMQTTNPENVVQKNNNCSSSSTTPTPVESAPNDSTSSHSYIPSQFSTTYIPTPENTNLHFVTMPTGEDEMPVRVQEKQIPLDVAMSGREIRLPPPQQPSFSVIGNQRNSNANISSTTSAQASDTQSTPKETSTSSGSIVTPRINFEEVSLALYNALRNKQWVEAEKLIQLGVGGMCWSDTTRSGITPLHLAIESKAPRSLIQCLLKNGAALDAFSSEDRTPVHTALAVGYWEIMPDLLKMLSEQEMTTCRQSGEEFTIGLSLLHFAALCGAPPEVIKSLIARRVCLRRVHCHLNNPNEPVDGRDSEGNTPLSYAVLYGHVETAKALIEAGADVNALSGFRTPKWAYAFASPLHLVIFQKGPQELISMLIEAGAKINAEMNIFCRDGNKRHFEKCTPLHLAALKGEIKTIQRLVDAHANINARDGGNKTPLGWAVDCNQKEVVKELTRLGAQE